MQIFVILVIIGLDYGLWPARFQSFILISADVYYTEQHTSEVQTKSNVFIPICRLLSGNQSLLHERWIIAQTDCSAFTTKMDRCDCGIYCNIVLFTAPPTLMNMHEIFWGWNNKELLKLPFMMRNGSDFVNPIFSIKAHDNTEFQWLQCHNMFSLVNRSCILPSFLAHWGRGTHICVGKPTIIGSDNGLSPGRRQAIIWTNAGILFIWPLGTNFSEILIEILTFSFKKMRLKVSSVKWRPCCLGLNVLEYFWWLEQ